MAFDYWGLADKVYEHLWAEAREHGGFPDDGVEEINDWLIDNIDQPENWTIEDLSAGWLYFQRLQAAFSSANTAPPPADDSEDFTPTPEQQADADTLNVYHEQLLEEDDDEMTDYEQRRESR